MIGTYPPTVPIKVGMVPYLPYLHVKVWHIPVFVLLCHLVIFVLLLLRLGAPLRGHLLAEIAEGDVWILCAHAVTPLVEEVHVAAEGLFRRANALGVAPFALRPASILGLIFVQRTVGWWYRLFSRHSEKSVHRVRTVRYLPVLLLFNIKVVR